MVNLVLLPSKSVKKATKFVTKLEKLKCYNASSPVVMCKHRHYFTSAAVRHGSLKLLIISVQISLVIFSFNQPPIFDELILYQTRPREPKCLRHT